MVKQFLLVVAVVLALRLPFLHQPIQGDDLYYLYGAEHALIDPAHPTHTKYIFMGDLVDMRGQSHPPLDSWILGGLLAIFGDVREVPVHLAYTIFSLIAAIATLSLARRFSSKPLLATLLFCAVPAFVVNGNSLEADLPFLAFWMGAVALFVAGVDRHSMLALSASSIAAGLAGLAAYQAIFLTPILIVFLREKRSKWIPAWAATLAAPAVLLAWQAFERATGGALPASMLAGYLSTYDFESVRRKGHAVVALLVNLAWMASPIVVIGAILSARKPHPQPASRRFLLWWVLIFFAGAVAVFFVGSARYLLPIAAPIAILTAEAAPRWWIFAGLAVQLVISLGLATVNYQHWTAYRDFATKLPHDAAGHRIWINADWGLRWYLEAEGGLPLAKNQPIQPGDIVVTSELANPLPPGVPLAPFAQMEISPKIPLRLISLNGHSAYSYGAHGDRPFEISSGPIDRVRAEIAVEPKLSYLDPKNPDAASQIISGLSSDGWMTSQARMLLKAPENPGSLEIAIYLPDNAPARRLGVSVNAAPAIEETIPGPGLRTFMIPAPAAKMFTVGLDVDKTFTVPGDARQLGLVIRGIGFTSSPPPR